MKNQSLAYLLQNNPFMKKAAIVGSILMTMTIESGVIYLVHFLQLK